MSNCDNHTDCSNHSSRESTDGDMHDPCKQDCHCHLSDYGSKGSEIFNTYKSYMSEADKIVNEINRLEKDLDTPVNNMRDMRNSIFYYVTRGMEKVFHSFVCVDWDTRCRLAEYDGIFRYLQKFEENYKSLTIDSMRFSIDGEYVTFHYSPESKIENGNDMKLPVKVLDNPDPTQRHFVESVVELCKKTIMEMMANLSEIRFETDKVITV